MALDGSLAGAGISSVDLVNHGNQRGPSEILVCPKCKGDLILTEAQDGLICYACALKYEIKDDIPIMLIDEAMPIKQEPPA